MTDTHRLFSRATKHDTAPMPRRLHPLLSAPVLAWAAACATSVTSASWKAVMRDVGAHYKVVHRAVDPEDKFAHGDGAQAELLDAAHAAREAARLVRTGYGAHEDLAIPHFGQLARDCEQWLLAIAHEAQRGDRERAKQLMLAQDPCTKCHEAAEKREW